MKPKLVLMLLGCSLIVGGIGTKMLPCLTFGISHDCCQATVQTTLVNPVMKCCNQETQTILPALKSNDTGQSMNSLVVVASFLQIPVRFARNHNDHWGSPSKTPSYLSHSILLL